MAHDIPKGLNVFSRRLLKSLLAKYPDWMSYAKVGGIYPEQDPVEWGTLLIRVPRPVSDGTTLEIATSAGEPQEVTISFGGTHRHCGAWDGEYASSNERETATLAEALRCTHALVDERLVARCMLKDGEVTSGGFFPPAGLAWAFSVDVGRVARVRSWRGTYDGEKPISEANPAREEREALWRAFVAEDPGV
jgi:hypothetical protein